MESTTHWLPASSITQNQSDIELLTDYVMQLLKTVILNLSPVLNKEKVSFPQYFLLTHLMTEEYMNMGDIAKKMGHSTAASTGLIDRLEKIGLVERIYAPEDRRKIMVKITQKGIELVTKMRAEISKKLQEMIKDSEKKTD